MHTDMGLKSIPMITAVIIVILAAPFGANGVPVVPADPEIVQLDAGIFYAYQTGDHLNFSYLYIA